MTTYKFETTEQRSQLMKKIRSTNTTPEVLFRKSLWAMGIRFRKNNQKIPGKPDISIPKHKIAVFIDGEFWHGYDWDRKKGKINANRDYWIPKIERNIERDKRNTMLLEKEGWTVVRFWEAEIKKNLSECLIKVLMLIGKTSFKDG